jgi:hypothetical protein
MLTSLPVWDLNISSAWFLLHRVYMFPHPTKWGRFHWPVVGFCVKESHCRRQCRLKCQTCASYVTCQYTPLVTQWLGTAQFLLIHKHAPAVLWSSCPSHNLVGEVAGLCGAPWICQTLLWASPEGQKLNWHLLPHLDLLHIICLWELMFMQGPCLLLLA